MALVWIGSMAEDILAAFRSVRRNAPRLIYTARVAISAWDAWEMPEIAERREALERRALADKRDLEWALVEAAHQQPTEPITR